jgi:pimeloyl-ACP methyl ester carboxylesterase
MSPNDAGSEPDGRTTKRPVRRTGFIERQGERIFYEDVGEGRTPLVLCHGAGGNHAIWYQQVASFAAQRRVVTWDHRGFGRSTDLAGQSGPDAATGDLLALLDALGIDRADLVGQSMGGWTVVGLALSRPERVRGLVLADTLGGFTSPEIAAASVGGARGGLGAGTLLGSHPALSDGFSARHPEQAHLYQSLGQMGSPALSQILPRLGAAVRGPEEAAKLTMPVLCIVGSEDRIFAPGQVRALAGLLPNAQVREIARCGHSPYFEDASAWNAALNEFLTHLDRLEVG